MCMCVVYIFLATGMRMCTKATNHTMCLEKHARSQRYMHTYIHLHTCIHTSPACINAQQQLTGIASGLIQRFGRDSCYVGHAWLLSTRAPCVGRWWGPMRKPRAWANVRLIMWELYLWCMYVCMYVCMFFDLARLIWSWRTIYAFVCMYVCIHIYIYIHNSGAWADF